MSAFFFQQMAIKKKSGQMDKWTSGNDQSHRQNDEVACNIPYE